MTEYNYYQEQLDSLECEFKEQLKVKFNNENSKETKWMSLNEENIDTFINFLQKLKNEFRYKTF